MPNRHIVAALEKLKNKHVLVTGGAGFIGSNIVDFLLRNKIRVSVLDNFSTGNHENIIEHKSNSLFNLIEGDIRDKETCLNALNGIDVVSHQAALGSVPRSIEFPLDTHMVNATGFINMLHAAKEIGLKRFVYASSSSVYGNSKHSPKRIGEEDELLSPYAVTKRLNEEYAKVYRKLHASETIGLRYFNVFGPKQDPNGVYAAAIPKFIDKMIKGEQLTINGDGEQTRDFTFVMNAVNANLLALSTDNSEAFGKTFNIACGDSYSLNKVIEIIRLKLQELSLYNDQTSVVHGPSRAGDVKHSLADISETVQQLAYSEIENFDQGISEYLEFFCKK